MLETLTTNQPQMCNSAKFTVIKSTPSKSEFLSTQTDKLTWSLRLPVIARATELAPVPDVVLLADADAAVGGRSVGHEAGREQFNMEFFCLIFD